MISRPVQLTERTMVCSQLLPVTSLFRKLGSVHTRVHRPCVRAAVNTARDDGP